MNIVGQHVNVQVGPYTSLTTTSALVIEQIGNGYLVRTDFEKYASVHYDFCGKLHTTKLFDDERQAREEAEATKGMIS